MLDVAPLSSSWNTNIAELDVPNTKSSSIYHDAIDKYSEQGPMSAFFFKVLRKRMIALLVRYGHAHGCTMVVIRQDMGYCDDFISADARPCQPLWS